MTAQIIERIYFDMDGVLADFQRGIEELCGCSEDTPDDEMWERMKHVPHFYAKLHPVEGAVDMVMNIMSRYPGKCEILTAVPKPWRGLPDATQDKIDWVKRYIPDDIKVNTVYREEKQDFCTGSGSILIDDWYPNIEEWEAKGGTAILFTDCGSIKSLFD